MKDLKLKFKGTVEEHPSGRKGLSLDNSRGLSEYLRSFKNGQRVQMEIKPLQRQRSKEQNAYWWGVCYPILADVTGHEVNEVHEICKRQFLKPAIIEVKDELFSKVPDDFRIKEVERIPSTTELTVSEGVEYTDNLRNLAQDLGSYIPTPEEAGYM